VTDKFSVLVVEDERIIARQLASCVEAHRWYTLAGLAGTAQQAIDVASRAKPDLVLLDFSLPDSVWDGFGVWAVLHKLPKSPDVIAVTGAQETSIVERARQYGACDYALKPFTRAKISGILDTYAYNRRRRPSGPVVTQPDIPIVLGTTERPLMLPAGLQEVTLNAVVAVLRAAPGSLQAAEVGERIGIDRVTANRYLKYLCKEGIAERVPERGHPGPPPFVYSLAPVWR
jgi:response regulator of citrate/malate metabolism